MQKLSLHLNKSNVFFIRFYKICMKIIEQKGDKWTAAELSDIIIRERLEAVR